MNGRQILLGMILISLLAAGCSAFPGLRVLTGETSPEGLVAETVDVADLVMADKSGVGDPSLMTAADRIEAASGYVDIIEIRRVEDDDAFVVNLVVPGELLPTDVASAIQYYDIMRRFVELSWQGTLHESEGSGVLKVNIYYLGVFPTLDSSETPVGILFASTEIDREEALVYLSHRPHSLDDFINLILDGTLRYESPADLVLYEGESNHPIFMLSIPTATAQGQ